MVRIDKNELQSLRTASVDKIARASKEIVQRVTADSTIFDAEAESRVSRFDLDELVLGHVLGRGGFCAVRELTSIKMPQTDDQPKPTPLQKLFGCCSKQELHPSELLGDMFENDGYSNAEAESVTEATSDIGGSFTPRESIVRRATKYSRQGGTSKYVVKQVNGELQYSDKIAYLKAIVDIELEAKYMIALNHPNILRVRGMSNPHFGETFLILDRLKETLGKKLQDWLRRHRQCSGITGAVVGSKAKKEDLLVERLVAAYNIADALDYLHSKSIIFRDCKPDNIGFCSHGNLKLFDFGLAREVKESDRVKNSDQYNLTGFTGAIRYMAPEVGLRKPYNFKADVYSWSQLMWYILELEPPLGVYTPQMFKERVFKKGTRPAVMDSWPNHMGDLMKRCWSAKIGERPNFGEIKDKLNVVLLPYNTKKMVPNRFDDAVGGEPAVPGSVHLNASAKATQQPPQQPNLPVQKEEGAAGAVVADQEPVSTSSESTTTESLMQMKQRTAIQTGDCCDDHGHGASDC